MSTIPDITRELASVFTQATSMFVFLSREPQLDEEIRRRCLEIYNDMLKVEHYLYPSPQKFQEKP